ncbi:MAG: carbohydrate kinase [Bacillota bacterium]|jgi:fructokinase|nr:carbohydrate kinase [Bacillota bacterium]
MTKAKAPIVMIGETLIDLYLDGLEESSPGQKNFAFTGAIGGGPANAAASLAYLGKPVSLITSFSKDPLGVQMKELLLERGIDLSLSCDDDELKMPLVLVLLDEKGERSFKLYLADTVFENMAVDPQALPEEMEFFHFSSVLMVFDAAFAATEIILEHVKDKNVIRSYDVNIRPDILKTNPMALQRLMQVLDQVDVLKISDEDLEWIQSNIDSSLAKPEDYFRYGIQLVVYTQGEKGATLITPQARACVPAPKVQVVDTTGGGDAFMAGILDGLSDQTWPSRISLQSIPEEQLRELGLRGAESAKRVLSQPGGMPPLV